jgi:predicted anti-sigma-YlaC factor YlaD
MGLRQELRDWRHRRQLAITCRAAVELMTDYLEGAVTGKERDRFEQHLRHCQPCARILEQMRAVPSVVRAVDTEALDPATRAELIELYRSTRGG